LHTAQFTTRLPLHVWTHVAMTYDGAQILLYVNGELVARDPYASGPIVPSSSDLLIGSNGEGYPFTGTLDELRITGGP